MVVLKRCTSCWHGPGRLAVAVALVWLAMPLRADPPYEAAAIKAAIVRSLIEFTYWPALPAELRLCSVGHDELGPALAGLHGNRAHKSVLAIRRQVSLDALATCHVVYLPAAEKRQLASLLNAVRGKPVLVIADFPGGAQLGATLSLHPVADRLGFDANLAAAQAAGLQLSTRLLQLAQRVY